MDLVNWLVVMGELGQPCIKSTANDEYFNQVTCTANTLWNLSRKAFITSGVNSLQH